MIGRHVDDVLHRTAARKIVGRFCQTLQDRTDRSRSRQPLRQFVTDISGLKIRKDQCIRAALHGACRRLRLRDFRNQRRIRLKFAIDDQFRMPRFHCRHGFANPIQRRMIRTAFRRKRKKRDAGLGLQKNPRISCRVQSDVGQLGDRRNRNDGTIGKDQIRSEDRAIRKKLETV